jgi:hypothetical protein
VDLTSVDVVFTGSALGVKLEGVNGWLLTAAVHSRLGGRCESKARLPPAPYDGLYGVRPDDGSHSSSPKWINAAPILSI